MLFCHLLCRFIDIWVETYHFKMNHTNIRYTFMISSARGHHIPFPFFPGSYFSSSLPRTCQSSSVFASIYLQKKNHEFMCREDSIHGMQLKEEMQENAGVKKSIHRISLWSHRQLNFYQCHSWNQRSKNSTPLYINIILCTPIHVPVMKYTRLIELSDCHSWQ